jgi:ankyrin repeat protein
LLENGADIKTTDNNLNNLLCGLFEFPIPVDPDVLELLLEKGADVNAANDLGYTPLLKAIVFSVDTQIISILLKNGAKVYYESDFGDSIKDKALEARNARELIPLLQKYGLPQKDPEKE